jgi:hypothetical protein
MDRSNENTYVEMEAKQEKRKGSPEGAYDILGAGLKAKPHSSKEPITS